jgi:hypothetical protein
VAERTGEFEASCSFTSAVLFERHFVHDGKVEPWSHVIVVAVAGASKSLGSRCLPQAMQWM